MLAVQGTFNRTAYGIETGEVQVFRQFDTILLIAPLMELKHLDFTESMLLKNTFNRTAYGIETWVFYQ